MYRKPCIDVTQFCNDLCIGHNVAMIRDTFVALRCSPIHAEPTGFAVSKFPDKNKTLFEDLKRSVLSLKIYYSNLGGILILFLGLSFLSFFYLFQLIFEVFIILYYYI
jgi:hypothetical protein